MLSPNNSSENLRLERDRFVAFAFAHADVLIELNQDGIVAFADGATHSLLDVEPAHMIGNKLLDYVRGKDKELFGKLVNPQSGKIRFENIKLGLMKKDKREVCFDVSGYAIPYLKNHIYLTLTKINRDIDDDQLAQRDSATGLLNRDTFAWQVMNTSKSLVQNGEELFMTMLDISVLTDGFDGTDSDKEMLVVEICDYIRTCSIDGDAAGVIEDGKICVIHSKLVKAEEIGSSLALMAVHNDVKSEDIIIESIKLDVPSLTEEESAKAILYTLNNYSKTGIHKTISSFSQYYRLMLGDTVKKVSEFKRVCYEKDFDIAFQPIVQVSSGGVHHYEALVRLRQNLFNNPYDFVTFGEKGGFVPEFDMAMCQKAMSLMNELDKDKGSPQLSLNLSGISIDSDLFKEALIGLIKKHPELNGKIMFEITESARIENLAKSNGFIQDLRKMGNLCCIDDFGAGESTFDYIRHIDVDYIKLDGSYVRDCDSNERSRHLLKAMVGVCKDLNIGTIAEMVESKQSADFIRSLGIEFGQGYYYGAPSTDTSKLKPYKKQEVKASGMGVKKMPSNKAWWASK